MYAINGWTHHVHLIVSIPPKRSVADVVKRLKGASAHYLNYEADSEETFGWQRGYGVLTLGERQRSTAEGYVRGQKEHHRQQATNSWLERVQEFDEGPPDEGLSPDEAVTILRESGGEDSLSRASTASEFPF